MAKKSISFAVPIENKNMLREKIFGAIDITAHDLWFFSSRRIWQRQLFVFSMHWRIRLRERFGRRLDN